MKKLIAAVCALGMCAAAAVPQTICAQEFEEMETSTHGGSSENAADIVHFEDPKLEELILNTEQFGYKIDANEDGVLTKEEMGHLHGLNASGMGITSLEGIQYAGHEAGNSIFDFSDNAITDLTPIAELYAAHPDAFFQTIDLRNNQISDFSALFGMSMNRLNGLAIAGNPAPADHYFTLWGTPDEIFTSRQMTICCTWALPVIMSASMRWRRPGIRACMPSTRVCAKRSRSTSVPLI